MQRNRIIDFGESSSAYEPAHERSGTPHDTGSPRMEQSHSGEMRHRALLTPHSSTSDKYRRTTQNTGSARRSETQSEERKRKQALTPSISTPEKVRRAAHGGRFVNSLIEQWVKNTGAQVPVPQPETPGDGSMDIENEAHGQDCEAHRHALRSLKKKLQDSQETVMEFHAWRENELKLKDEIVTKINANWESMGVINKFSDYVTECLTVFQQKYDSLSALYNDVIVAERGIIQKLRQKLEGVQSKGNDNQKLVAVMEERLRVQEQQMLELQRDMKKQKEDAEDKVRMIKNQLESTHAEEKLKLTKERNELIMQKEQLESKLRRIEESSKNTKEEATEYKSKLDDLVSQNAELVKNVESSTVKKNKLAAELESKTQKLDELEKYLNERQKIETDLSKDLDTIGSKYSNQLEQCKTLQENFNEVQRKLEEVQQRNTDLENTVDKLKTNNKSEIVHLMEQMEILKKEKEDALREERKNADMEISKRAHEYHTKISSLKDTIAEQYASLTTLEKSLDKNYEEKENLQDKLYRINENNHVEVAKLKDSLDKSYAENKSLQDKFNRMKESNDQLRADLKNMTDSLAEAKVAAELVLQETRKVRLKSSELQPVKEERTSSLKSNQQAGESKTAKHTRSFTSAEYARANKQERMSLSQPVGAQKKVRFDISSPKQDTQVDPFSFSPPTDDSQTQPSVSKVSKATENSEKSGTASPKYKFFKSRGTSIKQYGNQRKGRGRK